MLLLACTHSSAGRPKRLGRERVRTMKKTALTLAFALATAMPVVWGQSSGAGSSGAGQSGSGSSGSQSGAGQHSGSGSGSGSGQSGQSGSGSGSGSAQRD